ncbi:MAG: NAD(P)-dependent oxidoreductase [Bacteroidales bacterium]
MKKVLFVDTTHEVLPQGLESLGFACDHFDLKTKEEYKSIVSSYSGLVVRSKIKIDKDIIDSATSLEFIARVGAGLENIDVPYAKQKGVYCLNSPEGNRDAVGEQSVGMLLMLMNNLLRADEEVRRLVWRRKENRGSEIKGRTIGIIGYGNMGQAFAQRISGFGANVIAYDKYRKNYSDEYAQEVSLEELKEHSDILSLHIPLTEETKFLFNKEFIQSFKKDFWFVNTSRGPICKTNDLVEALDSGKIIGAALDVLEYEKLGFESIEKNNIPKALNALIESDRVVLSPHIAGWTHESNYKLSKVIVDKVAALIQEDSLRVK